MQFLKMAVARAPFRSSRPRFQSAFQLPSRTAPCPFPRLSAPNSPPIHRPKSLIGSYSLSRRYKSSAPDDATKTPPVPLRRVRATNRDAARMREFFDKYPSFDYNSSKPMISEFHRMCQRFKWNKKSNPPEQDDQSNPSEKDEKPNPPERDKAHKAFKIALTHQFNDFYGTEFNDLVAWQNLCRRLEIEPIPEELQACRDIVVETHVNLIDLVDNRSFKIFKSLGDLQAYTILERKYFPLEEAYAGGLLKYLLREIFHEYNGYRKKQSRDRPRRDGPA